MPAPPVLSLSDRLLKAARARLLPLSLPHRARRAARRADRLSPPHRPAGRAGAVHSGDGLVCGAAAHGCRLRQADAGRARIHRHLPGIPQRCAGRQPAQHRRQGAPRQHLERPGAQTHLRGDPGRHLPAQRAAAGRKLHLDAQQLRQRDHRRRLPRRSSDRQHHHPRAADAGLHRQHPARHVAGRLPGHPGLARRDQRHDHGRAAGVRRGQPQAGLRGLQPSARRPHPREIRGFQLRDPDHRFRQADRRHRGRRPLGAQVLRHRAGAHGLRRVLVLPFAALHAAAHRVLAHLAGVAVRHA